MTKTGTKTTKPAAKQATTETGQEQQQNGAGAPARVVWKRAERPRTGGRVLTSAALDTPEAVAAAYAPHPLDDAPDKDRLRAAIEAAGFAFAASDGGADGFQHKDGRAATVKDGHWALRHPDGSASEGRTPRALEIELAMSPRLAPRAEDDAKGMMDLAATASKKKRRLGGLEPSAPRPGDEELLPHAFAGDGGKCGLCFKALGEGSHVAEEATSLGEDIAAARAARAMPAPANVVRAVEMLGYHTGATFDLSKMGGDKRYGQRVAMLKKLLCATKVLVKDSGPKQLGDAFHSAVGAKGENAGAKAADFAARCKALLAAAVKAKSAETRAVTKAKASALAAAGPDLTVAGDAPLPAYEKRGKAERAEELEATIRELGLAASEPVAAPRPGAEVELVAGEVWLLEDTSNRIVMLCLERPNSQGAVCVYNNGTRVAVGVVPREVLVKMRQVQDVDPVSAARELLNPTTPGVAVTPTAARHLQAVADCRELTMPNTKKFAAKKQAAKAEKPAKAAKTKKEPTERKSSLFRLKNDTKKTWEAFQTQKGELIAAFVKLGAVGAKATGATRAQLVAALPKIDPKNISFYLSKWQPDILEKLAPAE